MGTTPPPTRREYPPAAVRHLLGSPDGRALDVRGDSMASWDIHDGDTAWIDPAEPVRVGVPVLVEVTGAAPGEENGFLIRELGPARSGAPGQPAQPTLYASGTFPDGTTGRRITQLLPTGTVTVVGPVIYVTRGHAPRWLALDTADATPDTQQPDHQPAPPTADGTAAPAAAAAVSLAASRDRS